MNDQHLRMSDIERDLAAAELGEHYAQGRLSVDEHSERLDRIWAARTRGELGPIFADLPGPVTATSPLSPRRAAQAQAQAPAPAFGSRPRRPLRFRGLPLPLVMLLAVLLVVTVMANLPLILVGLGVWFLVSRGACSARRPQARWPR